MRTAGVIRFVLVLFTLVVTWLFSRTYLRDWPRSFRNLADLKPAKNKCGNIRSCAKHHFAFKIISGAANVIGPSMCLEDKMIMGNVQNNVGRGINIAFINGANSEVLKCGSFNLYAEDPTELIEFVKPVPAGTVVMIATYDEPASKLTDEARKYFTDMGSAFGKNISFRDNWVFLGVVGMNITSPYEKVCSV
uniref:Protein FAM3D isoform X2 n=1 Tax=Geotrypetes seraphini TaxID=260995 RepID=A0A6P8Q3X7_GEOSA|nr:protein FAM3D isoform X2 [Geotrypetes seraphini]